MVLEGLIAKIGESLGHSAGAIAPATAAGAAS